jgi:hypothetical protein
MADFDWKSGSFTADYSLGSATIEPELPNWDIGGDSVPTYTPGQTSNPTPSPTGDFFGNLLKGVTSSAETFLSGVQKVYALDNQISSTKLQQQQIASAMRVQELTTVGGLDLKSAQLQAQKEIGIAQAQAAVKNEQARIASSQGASIVSIPSAIPTPLLLIGGAIALYFISRRGAA